MSVDRETYSNLGDLERRVEQYRLRSHRAARAQYLAGKKFAMMHNSLGVPTVCLSAIVSTAIFASISKSPATAIIALTGIVSLAVAILSALQTFFGFANRSELHRSAGAQYAGIKRSFDILLLRLRGEPTPASIELLQELQKLVEALNETEKAAPDVPDALYDRAKSEQLNDREGI